MYQSCINGSDWWWFNGVGDIGTAYRCTFADNVHPFMTTVYSSCYGYFQHDNEKCHKPQIISNWFLEHDNGFIILKWTPQSPDLNPVEHLWDVVE